MSDFSLDSIDRTAVGRSLRERTGDAPRLSAVAEGKLLEESVLQVQKMEAIGRLAGGVAHDFNTLLGTITGYAELLRDSADGDGRQLGRDRVLRFADKIHRAAERGARLTGQLLAFSRQQNVQPRPVDLDAVTRETADMIQRLIGEDIAFEYEVDSRLGRVTMDSGQLQQVLLNLAVNAADAMPKGGSLSMRWKQRTLRQDTPMHGGTAEAGVYAELEVTDSGVGMDEETMGKIFEPFFTTKRSGKGTGLGLSTVFGIVRQWRGCLDVSSRPNEGTTFRIYLPETDGSDDGAASSSSIRRPTRRETGRGETVLLVEDDDMFRDLVSEVLESNGYRVLAADCPATAAPMCREPRIEVDVLVSDLVMPDGNGVDLAARMRSRYPRLRVVLMSGYSDEDLAPRELDESTADEFLHKPFSIGSLLEAVGRVLAPGRSRHRARRRPTLLRKWDYP